MLDIIVTIAAVTIMVKAADMENRSTVFWGALTLALCLGAGMLIPLPLINIVIGLAASYFLMLLVNLARKE